MSSAGARPSRCSVRRYTWATAAQMKTTWRTMRMVIGRSPFRGSPGGPRARRCDAFHPPSKPPRLDRPESLPLQECAHPVSIVFSIPFWPVEDVLQRPSQRARPGLLGNNQDVSILRRESGSPCADHRLAVREVLEDLRRKIEAALRDLGRPGVDEDRRSIAKVLQLGLPDRTVIADASVLSTRRRNSSDGCFPQIQSSARGSLMDWNASRSISIPRASRASPCRARIALEAPSSAGGPGSPPRRDGSWGR